eukprot:gb/GECG01002837.1/.p1 GENE.gb/GECG01002837.1/~~gb/GECG01002837.1/.p1  ORF type:complete len:238 (+),score=45.93 gb/GECG01002837.1/:1-714(+)
MAVSGGGTAFGQCARDLVLDTYRSKLLNAYNDDGVRRVIEEIRALNEDVTDAVEARKRLEKEAASEDNNQGGHEDEEDQEGVDSNKREEGQREKNKKKIAAVSAGMVTQYYSIKRNKRLLLAYLNERMRRIEDLRWYYGAVLPEKLRNNMSVHEHNYLKGYSELLNRYMQKVGVDLTTDLRPPKHLNVKVSVEEDCGEIMTYRGSVKLEKGAVLSLRRTDVDHLIRQGKLKEIDHDN